MLSFDQKKAREQVSRQRRNGILDATSEPLWPTTWSILHQFEQEFTIIVIYKHQIGDMWTIEVAEEADNAVSHQRRNVKLDDHIRTSLGPLQGVFYISLLIFQQETFYIII